MLDIHNGQASVDLYLNPDHSRSIDYRIVPMWIHATLTIQLHDTEQRWNLVVAMLKLSQNGWPPRHDGSCRKISDLDVGHCGVWCPFCVGGSFDDERGVKCWSSECRHNHVSRVSRERWIGFHWWNVDIGRWELIGVGIDRTFPEQCWGCWSSLHWEQ